MAGVLSEDPQAPFTGDQQLIQASATGVADLTFGDRVRTASSATARPDDRYRRVRVTHRFHPQSCPDFDFAAYRQNRGEDQVQR